MESELARRLKGAPEDVRLFADRLFVLATSLFRSGKHQMVTRIRPATPDDSAGIAFVLAEAFREYKSLYTAEGYAATTPSADEIEQRFENESILVAVSGKEIIGTVTTVPQEGDLYIRSMAILPSARGQQLGEDFLAEIESFALAKRYKRLVLHTTTFLDRAIRLYEKFGFVPMGVDDLHGTLLIKMTKDLRVSREGNSLWMQSFIQL